MWNDIIIFALFLNSLLIILPVSAFQVKKTSLKEMEIKFYGLSEHIATTLGQRMSMELDEQTSGVMFQQFHQYVAGVCNDGSVQNKTKVVEIFRTIREKKCWDLNEDPYNLLLSIVRGVEDTELTASVQKERDTYYKKYLVSTNVADHLSQCGAKQPEFESDFIKLSMKLDEVNIHECSMAHLIDFWTEVKRCVKLPDLFSVLLDIEECCFSVTWLVPVYAFPAFMRLPHSSPDLFRRFSILRMNIGGICFFRVRVSVTL